MIGVKHQANIEDARIALRRRRALKHIEKVCGNVQIGIGLDRFKSAANAIRGCDDRWKLRSKPDGRFETCFTREVPRVWIVKLKSRYRRPQDIDRVGFTRKLLHQSN